jgi:uncharacterized membrane-anchored protein YhcB (DUF1043 family)
MDTASSLASIQTELDALQKRIDEQKIKLAQHSDRQAHLDQDWKAMVSRHEAILQKAAGAHASRTLVDELKIEVDTLKQLFSRWILKNDKKF